jgi:hypothetical protein
MGQYHVQLVRQSLHKINGSFLFFLFFMEWQTVKRAHRRKVNKNDLEDQVRAILLANPDGLTSDKILKLLPEGITKQTLGNVLYDGSFAKDLTGGNGRPWKIKTQP